MHCPVCHSEETKVVDSRLASDGYAIRRRRECTQCEYRFSTMEELELLDIVVVKNDGRRETYLRKKLETGILHSLTKRPYTQENFDKMIHGIERKIQKKNRREVSSTEIGEIVMAHLKRFDKVAYIRFASIYRAFEDVKKFQKEVRELENHRGRRNSEEKQV